MAAQLFADGTIDLLGFTVATGNEWRDQEVAECLKAVERMGIEKHVKVYVGSQYPILHDFKDYLYEVQLFGPPIDYVGAYSNPQPNPNDLARPRLRPARGIRQFDIPLRVAQRGSAASLVAGPKF
jgi:inosine-uridine nucleoside N-ribohydrolase